MSIWISEARQNILRCALALGLVLALLAGCAQTGGESKEAPQAAQPGARQTGGFFARLSSGLGAGRPLVKTGLAGDEIIVTAPRGFCIDAGSRRGGRRDGFVILASCASMTDAPGAAPAILTVTVSEAGYRGPLPTAEDLATGTGALGVAAQRMDDGIAIVQLTRGGDRAIAAADPRHWRAALVVNGRLIALAAYGPPDSALSRSTGGDILADLGRKIRDASPKTGESGPPDVDASARVEDEASEPRSGLRKLLGRLFQ